jgi:tetratricopeptide (TPR) repeat protein
MANSNQTNIMTELIFEYEAMSQKGTVVFVERTVIYKLIKHYRQAKNIEEALRVVGYGLEQFPDASEMYAYKASLLAEIHQEELALHYLETALLLAPNDSQLMLIKAEILVRTEQYDEALDLISQLKAFASPKEIEFVYLLEAEVYENTDNYEEMYDALEVVLGINRNNEEALSRMWLAMELTERYEEGIELHTSITDEEPYSYLAWHNLGHAYLGLHEYENAIEAYEFAIVANENFEYPYRDCAAAYFQQRNYAKALDLYREVIERFEADYDVLTKAGYCQQRLEQYTAATIYYKKALELQAQHAEAHFRMGECLALQRNFLAAEQCFLQAIELDDRHEDYHYALGQTYSILKKQDLASEAFCKANEIAPENTEFWIGHANFYRYAMQYDAALDILEEAEMNITSTDLLYSRTICLFAAGRRKEALSCLQLALTEDFYLHKMLFDELPHLENDREVLSLIHCCQGEE